MAADPQEPAMPAPAANLSPARIFETINGFHRSAVLTAGIELEVFTAIGEGANTVPAIAKRAKANERGMRILCDALTVIEFLTKSDGGVYALTAESALFLDKRSPAYLGSISTFLNSAHHRGAFERFTQAVKQGSSAVPEDDVLEPDHPEWKEFAHSMAPLMFPLSKMMAGILAAGAPRKMRVIDVAAGHGLFGIAIAQANPQAEIIAVDWPNVLTVGEENAARAGIKDRWHKLPGSAFDVDFGKDNDLVLYTNFLHHFDVASNEKLLRRAFDSLKPGGKVAILEFVPNDDRVSPPMQAMFATIMLASTPAGDAYTYAELEGMCRKAGFGKCERYPLPPSTEDLIVATK